MKKIRCYSKACSFIFLFMFALIVIITVKIFTLPKQDEPVIYKILMICVLVSCFLVIIYGFFHFRQYLYVDNGKFILKDNFVKIKELNIDDCYYEISTLRTHYARIPSYEKWICIYSTEETNKFKEGLSNSRKYNRIQVMYNEKNMKFVEQYLKKDASKNKNRNIC